MLNCLDEYIAENRQFLEMARKDVKKGRQFNGNRKIKEYEKQCAKAANAPLPDHEEHLITYHGIASDEVQVRTGADVGATCANYHNYEPIPVVYASENDRRDQRSQKKASMIPGNRNNSNLQFIDDEDVGLTFESYSIEERRKKLGAQFQAEYQQYLTEVENKEKKKITENFQPPIHDAMGFSLPSQADGVYDEMFKKKLQEEKKYRDRNFQLPSYDSPIPFKSQTDAVRLESVDEACNIYSREDGMNRISSMSTSSASNFPNTSLPASRVFQSSSAPNKRKNYVPRRHPVNPPLPYQRPISFSKIFSCDSSEPKRGAIENNGLYNLIKAQKQERSKFGKKKVLEEDDKERFTTTTISRLQEEGHKDIKKQMNNWTSSHRYKDLNYQLYGDRTKMNKMSVKEKEKKESAIEQRDYKKAYILAECSWTPEGKEGHIFQMNQKELATALKSINEKAAAFIITDYKQVLSFLDELKLKSNKREFGAQDNSLAEVQKEKLNIKDVLLQLKSVEDFLAEHSENPIFGKTVDNRKISVPRLSSIRTGGGGEPVRDGYGNIITSRVAINPSRSELDKKFLIDSRRQREIEYRKELYKQAEEKRVADKQRKEKEQIEDKQRMQQVEKDRIRMQKEYEEEQALRIQKDKEIRDKIAKNVERQAAISLQTEKRLAEEAEIRKSQRKILPVQKTETSTIVEPDRRSKSPPVPAVRTREIMDNMKKKNFRPVDITEVTNLKPNEVMGKLTEIRQFAMQQQRKMEEEMKKKNSYKVMNRRVVQDDSDDDDDDVKNLVL